MSDDNAAKALVEWLGQPWGEYSEDDRDNAREAVQVVLAAARPATPTPGETEGQAGSGERIPGRDYCPLDGEPLKMVIQAKGKPTLYIHADGFTWHPDASGEIRTAADILGQLGSGSPQHLKRPEPPEHYAQPTAPATPTWQELLPIIRGGMPTDCRGEDDAVCRNVALCVEMHLAWRAKQPISQPAAPADDTATVLAGLREEMVNRAERGDCTNSEGEIWDEAIALVEAAQQRLAERGRGGGSDG